MMPFEYIRPHSVADAVQAMNATARYIAGGTNLLDLMKLQVETPSTLVDISRLPLDKVSATPEGGLRIGAMVRNADLAANQSVRQNYPVLSMALLAGASGQLRNMATTGGNLLQRTRCYYFYDTNMPCNKRTPNSGCAAMQGYNRIHAIVGTSSSCIATHPSDMAVAMRLLDAQIEATSADGKTRLIHIAQLHRLPGDTPHLETTLAPSEIITAVILPPPPKGVSVYRKVRDRASYAFALVSVAAVIESTQGKITSARLAFGGIAPKPWRVEKAETFLVSGGGSDEAIKATADAVLEGAQGHGANDFKIPLLRRTLASVIREAMQV